MITSDGIYVIVVCVNAHDFFERTLMRHVQTGDSTVRAA